MENINVPKDLKKIKVDHPAQLHRVMKEILIKDSLIDQAKVHFWIISLNHYRYIDTIDLVAFGDRRHVDPDWGGILTYALQKGSASLILAQNRVENQSLQPTEADMDITEYLYHVGQYLNIPVLDHLIFNLKEKFLVLSDEQLFDAVLGSSRYQGEIQRNKLVKELRKIYLDKGIEVGIEVGVEEGRQIGKAEGLEEGMEKGIEVGKVEGKVEGAQEKAVEAAQKMLVANLPIEQIIEFTGLTAKEVAGLKNADCRN